MPAEELFPVGENLPDPVFLFDESDRRLIWMNNAAQIWIGRPLSKTIGKSVCTFGSGFEEVEKQILLNRDAHQSYRGHDLRVTVRRNDYMCRYQIFNCRKGIAVHFDPRQQGVALPRTKVPDPSVTMLGKMLAHELKNPLAGIRGAAQLLESEMKSEEDLELTDLIKTEVDRIGRLAEKMEGFGQSGSTDFKPFNVHEVLRKATLLFDKQTFSGLDFIETFDPSLPNAMGDVDGIMQVVVNLISNAVDAIQHSETGDSIEIRTGYRTGIKKRSVAGDNRPLPIEIQIIDNGPGIPDHIRERVFQPFVTSKANGQGLGLSLISKIIEDHGGLIEASSEPGRTVFTFLLPASPDDQDGKVT